MVGGAYGNSADSLHGAMPDSPHNHQIRKLIVTCCVNLPQSSLVSSNVKKSHVIHDIGPAV